MIEQQATADPKRCQVCGYRDGLWVGPPMTDGRCPLTKSHVICSVSRDIDFAEDVRRKRIAAASTNAGSHDADVIDDMKRTHGLFVRSITDHPETVEGARANPKEMSVFALHIETSHQHGKDMLVGVFSHRQLAVRASGKIGNRRRSFIVEWKLDSSDVLDDAIRNLG